jgi:hypothetical protein
LSLGCHNRQLCEYPDSSTGTNYKLALLISDEYEACIGGIAVDSTVIGATIGGANQIQILDGHGVVLLLMLAFTISLKEPRGIFNNVSN